VAAVGQQVPEPQYSDAFSAFDVSAGKLIALERQTATIHGSVKALGYGGIKVAAEFKPGKSPIRFKSGDRPQFVVRSPASAFASIDPSTLYVLRALKKKEISVSW